MNYSNKNNLESRVWKSGFSKRSLTASTPSANSSPLLPMMARGNSTTTSTMTNSLNNNNNTNFSTSCEQIPQNRVPEIQMINKFYGLIPKKFVICERIRPHTVGPVRHRSTSGGTARPKSTKDSLISRGGKGGRFSRQNSCSSENDADAWEESNGQNGGNLSGGMPTVTTRRISFEKLYRKKPKKLVHSKSVEQSFGENPFNPEDTAPASFQRVIRIDLNQMKWEEDSIADEVSARSRDYYVGTPPEIEPSQPKPKKNPGIRKTISFDENVLQKDEAKIEPPLPSQRPATAKFPGKTAAEVETPTPVHWTTGKSTAERRAKLQRSFSIKDSSFDGGAESESEFPGSKYPESLVHSGRKSLHVEAAPEVDTMLSKLPNRGPKVEPEISVPKFELELSRLISESEALLLANPLDKIPTSKSKEAATMGSKNSELPNKNAINIPSAQSEENSQQVPPKKESELNNPIPIPENRIKALTIVERRKLLKKSFSLPNDNRGPGQVGPMKLYPKKLIRQNSLGGGAMMGIRAGVSTSPMAKDHVITSQSNNGVSNKSQTQSSSQVNRISIKKPLVEITRLRPKTAPTNSGTSTSSTASALDRDRSKRPQPLKARSGGHGVTTAMATSTGSTSAKPLPQTKGTDATKKHLSWSPSPARVDKDMPKSSPSQAKSPKPTAMPRNSKQINFKDKDKVPEVEEVGQEEHTNGDDNDKSGDGDGDRVIPISGRASLPRRSFSLDEGALLFYSNSRELPNCTASTASGVETSFQDSKKREQCVKIYEKMMKVGCGVRLQTILRGLMTPSEYRSFIAAAEKAAATAAAEKEAAEAELLAATEAENANPDAGVIKIEENMGNKINVRNSIETPIIIQTK